MVGIGNKLQMLALASTLYVALGILAADSAEAQCLTGPESATPTQTGSYFFNYKTCSYFSAVARVWVDNPSVIPGRWRHAAAQRTCDSGGGAWDLSLRTTRLVVATGNLYSLQGIRFDRDSCAIDQIVHQNALSGEWIVAARCQVQVNC